MQYSVQQQSEFSRAGERVRNHWRSTYPLLVLLGIAMLGCRDITGQQELPAGTADPNSYNTPAGALGQRIAALNGFITMWPQLIVDLGLFTDEATMQPGRASGQQQTTAIDQRNLPEGNVTTATSYMSDADYIALNKVRGLANQAIGQLAKYDPSASPALRGELFAIQGYTEILLADYFCSGIPLSTLDFQNDYTYAPGSTTAQVYQDAVAKFDSAIALSSDSALILNLARVGKGRALLDLGQYASAAQIVASVPDAFQYQIAGQWRVTIQGVTTPNDAFGPLQDANLEGGNGLPFVSSDDPRSTQKSVSGLLYGVRLEPTKIVGSLNSAGYVPLTIADGIEARLIQAEADLQAGDTVAWLGILNQLRQTALVPGTSAPNPTQLPPLVMPGTDSGRVSLMFQERAYWLYFTGHRQGDLRRLIRQYGRDESQVYPNGVYTSDPSLGFYGSDVTAPIPSSEYANPLFHGCINRGA